MRRLVSLLEPGARSTDPATDREQGGWSAVLQNGSDEEEQRSRV